MQIDISKGNSAPTGEQRLAGKTNGNDTFQQTLRRLEDDMWRANPGAQFRRHEPASVVRNSASSAEASESGSPTPTLQPRVADPITPGYEPGRLVASERPGAEAELPSTIAFVAPPSRTVDIEALHSQCCVPLVPSAREPVQPPTQAPFRRTLGSVPAGAQTPLEANRRNPQASVALVNGVAVVTLRVPDQAGADIAALRKRISGELAGHSALLGTLIINGHSTEPPEGEHHGHWRDQ